MKLLYCHVEFLDTNGNKKEFRGLEQIDLNLSATRVFSYDGHEGILCKRLRDKPLPENFWANGDTETNLYNVNVVAGKNGSGKSTVINYVIDLLYYIYLDFGRQETNIPPSARFDVEPNYNLLAFEENGLLYVVELLPVGSTRKKLEKCQVCECNGEKWDDATAQFIQGKKDNSKATKKFKKLFKATKIIYMMNNPTQRDYERNLNRQEGGLRSYFIYDCSLGAYLGGGMAQFFPYEVYKQVRYLFDPNQIGIRKEIEKRIQQRQKETEKESKKKPDELVMPKALRIRLRIDMLENGLIQKLTPSFPTDIKNDLLRSKWKLTEMLGELCCSAFAENAARTFDLDVGQLFNTYRDESGVAIVEELLYKPEAKIESLLEEQKHCLHAVANTAFCISHKKNRHSSVDCCVVLPDGRIASGLSDKTIRIWDIDTGECLRTLNEHTDRVCSLAVLRDGRIVSGSGDRTIRIWDADTGKCSRVLKRHTDRVSSLAVLSDGRIVSGSLDATIRIGHTDTDECSPPIKEHSGWVSCLAVLPNGNIVSGSGDTTIRTWDANTGECLRKFRTSQHNLHWVNCLAALSDGRIVSGSDEKNIRIWDPDTGDQLKMLKGTDWITCLAVLNDRHIVSGSNDGTIRIWNVDTDECLRILRGHTRSVNCLAVLSDGRIVSGSSDGTIRVWDSITYECISILSTETKHQLFDRLRRNSVEYLAFLSAAENDNLFAKFDRVENEDCCFELPLKPDEEGASQDERLKTDEKDASRDEQLQRFMTEFIQKYRYTCEPVYTIDFDWGLSSGEENMLRLFSNLFHIFDRDYSSGNYCECRIYNDEWREKTQRKPHECTSVMLFLDEADLTLHPEWQRRLIHVLTAALPLIYPNSCAKDIQLILSTHSPLLLGDIPRENICYLGNGRSVGASEASEETFGQNIHTLLKDSFFLDNGTVGEFASSKINGIAARLEEILRNETKVAEENSISVGTYRRPSAEELMDMRKIIDLVANGILRVWLEERWQKVSVVLNERMHSERAEIIAEEGEKLTREERRYILRKWLEEEKL